MVYQKSLNDHKVDALNRLPSSISDQGHNPSYLEIFCFTKAKIFYLLACSLNKLCTSLNFK